MATLGATLKVGMDTSAVQRGLASIRTMFGRLGATLRGIGGAMRKSLLPVVGLLAGFGVAARSVTKLGSELSDMSVQTGVSVGKLVEMQEALRLAGVPLRDTSRMLSLLASNLQEARFEGGAVREAFEDLGFDMSEFTGKNLAEAFEMILQRIGQSHESIKMLERDMEAIFGARMGFGIIRLAKDLNSNLEQARKNARSFAEFMDQNANSLDRTEDALGRIGMLFKEIIGRILVKLPIDRFAEALNSIDVGRLGDQLGAFFENPKAKLAEAWEFIQKKIAELWARLLEMLISAGEALGREIRKGIGGFFGGGGSASSGRSRDISLLENMDRNLFKLARKEGAVFG